MILTWNVVWCADDTLYTGITNDLEKRLAAHNGKEPGGARYTAGKRPVELVYSEKCDSRAVASTREWEIKQLTRSEKEKLFV